MKNEIIVNPKEFGIEEKQAGELIGNLPQIKEERAILETQFNEIIKLDIEDVETSKKARELRLLISKNRTKKLNVWHKTTKDYFLKGGQFIDAIKRKEVAVNEQMENDLLEIEKYQEIKQQKVLDELQEKRVKQLSEYVDDAEERNLSSMDNDVWTAYLTAKKQTYLDKIETEKKVEAERIAKEKAEEEERKRIKKENERLKKEADKREKELKIEADKRAKIEAARIAKEAKEREIRAEKEKKEREAYELKLKREREEKEKVAKENARIQKELQDKEDAEKKRLLDVENAKQIELQKGDTAKMTDFINDLEALKTKYSFKSKKNIDKYNSANILIDKIVDYIKK